MTARKTGCHFVMYIVIVLAIFSVVVVVLFPVHEPPGTASKTMCLSHLKQIGVAMHMYLADYNDHFPDRDDWMDATEPYTKKEELFHCPSLQEPKDPAIYGYAFNRKISRAKYIEKDANTPLMFESVNLVRNASGDIESLPNPGRHHGVNNIVYLDGRARGQKVNVGKSNG